MIAQFVTIMQVWLAIMQQGYAPQPMACYYEHGAPVLCRMPLSRQYDAGWLMVEVNGAIINITEHSCSEGDAG